MTFLISFQPIPILIDGHDTQGRLVLVDGQLVAVLARIDGEAHASEVKGQWHLEAGFGPARTSRAPSSAPWTRQEPGRGSG